MCRFAYIEFADKASVGSLLETFSRRCAVSPEYQGDGWGLSWWEHDHWETHLELCPIWERERSRFPSGKRFMIHARSAFKDHEICLENNMPFTDDNQAFAFNGELHGVRLRVPGSSGAAKIFRLLRRLKQENLAQRLDRGMRIICDRTRYIRACNLVWSTHEEVAFSSLFSESNDYFSPWLFHRGDFILSSERLSEDSGWVTLPSGVIGHYRDQRLVWRPIHPFKEVTACV